MTNESKDDICVRCGETTSAGLVTRQGNSICKTCLNRMEKQIMDVIKQAAREQAIKEVKEILNTHYHLATEAQLSSNVDNDYFIGAAEVLKEVIKRVGEL